MNPVFAGLVQKADLSLKSGAWNDKKITAHHGIIPTSHDQVSISALSDAEQKVYELIVKAYLVQFYPPHAFTKTVTVTNAGGHKWEAKGRVVKTPGWRSVMQPDKESKEKDEEEAQVLPLMKMGDTVDWLSGAVDHRVTKPPSRFTDGTLIAAMSSVHKYVTDPKIKARLKETSGLGTEATRANIIETLLKREFIERQGKQVISTERGRLLVAALPEVLTDPGVTGLWEDALSEVAAGTRTIREFEAQQQAFVTKRVEAAKSAAALALPSTAPVTNNGKSAKKAYKKTYKRRAAK